MNALFITISILLSGGIFSNPIETLNYEYEDIANMILQDQSNITSFSNFSADPVEYDYGGFSNDTEDYLYEEDYQNDGTDVIVEGLSEENTAAIEVEAESSGVYAEDIATESTSNNYCLWISNSEEEKTCCDILGFGNTTSTTNATSQDDDEIGVCAKTYLKMVDNAEGSSSGFGAVSFRSVARGEECKLTKAKWFMQILCCRQKLPNICHEINGLCHKCQNLCWKNSCRKKKKSKYGGN